MNLPANDDVGPMRVMTVSSEELRAYVDGRLNPGRRAEIEGFLACNPDLAANVMQALHHRDRARFVLPQDWHARLRHASRTFLICVSCGMAGWAVAAALDDDGPLRRAAGPPQYVDEAVMSQRATRVRIDMSSQVETPALDPAEIQRKMRLRLPVLPADWRVLDAQVYPSDDGPGVNLLIETAPGRQLNLFAVRANTAVTAEPVVTRKDGEYAAYWEEEDAAYVLTGDGSREELLARASLLSRNAMM